MITSVHVRSILMHFAVAKNSKAKFQSPHMGFNHGESVLIHTYIYIRTYIMVISVDTGQRMGINHDTMMING